YVNNPAVSTMDGSWLIQAYPGGTSAFTAFDGTGLQCQGTGASGTVTISSVPRAITLRILGDQPATVRRDNAVVPRQGAVGSRQPGWRYDTAAGFIEIDFTHTGERRSSSTEQASSAARKGFQMANLGNAWHLPG